MSLTQPSSRHVALVASEAEEPTTKLGLSQLNSNGGHGALMTAARHFRMARYIETVAKESGTILVNFR